MNLNTPSPLIVSLSDHVNQWASNVPNTSLYFYALADAGQDRIAWQRLVRSSVSSQPLLPSSGSSIDDFSPHLLHLGLATELSNELSSALSQNHFPAAFTLLCSPLPPAKVHTHLRHFTEVKLPGDYEMLLAYWDPAILGTLVGQLDDNTLHVPGPVLLPQQLQEFISPFSAWWYCDRERNWHAIKTPELPDSIQASLMQAFTLTQEQEDALVEASVPDQVLYHIENNRPTLFDTQLSHPKRYRFVRAVLKSARELGLEGMRDLANFVALCLIYRQRIETDQQILQLLDQVQYKKLTLDEAIKYMPE